MNGQRPCSVYKRMSETMGSSKFVLAVILLLQIQQWPLCCSAWISQSPPSQRTQHDAVGIMRAQRQVQPPRPLSSRLFASAPPKQKRGSVAVTPNQKAQDDEAPANIAGAEFFGGNKEKEQFYDEAAEETAGIAILDSDENEGSEAVTVESTETLKGPGAENTKSSQDFDRFSDRAAFATDDIASTARQIQMLINQVLYDDAESVEGSVSYASSLQWDSPLKKEASSRTPLYALEQALQDYRRVDVAVTAGRTASGSKDNVIELDWEVSLVWPTFWEPRVLVLGSSQIEINGDSSIVRQVDEVFGASSNNIEDKVLVDQIVPRFWDLYHIGMTPSAELSPRCEIKNERGFQVVNLPGRWVVNPTMMDENDVKDVSTPKSSANLLPFHAFNSVIKTVGPTKQQYVPTSPLEIQIVPTETSVPMLKWQVPISVEFQSQLSWPNPDPSSSEEGAEENLAQSTTYTWQPPRRMAVVDFAGEGPQDAARIPEARKRLYEAVASKSEWKVKFQDDRPVFSFWKNAFKGCYTEQGLGMAVYEWRPSGGSLAGNQIGMELEL